MAVGAYLTVAELCGDLLHRGVRKRFATPDDGQRVASKGDACEHVGRLVRERDSVGHAAAVTSQFTQNTASSRGGSVCAHRGLEFSLKGPPDRDRTAPDPLRWPMSASAPSLTSKGASKGWSAAQKNVVRICGLFLKSVRTAEAKNAEGDAVRCAEGPVRCAASAWLTPRPSAFRR